MLSLVMVAAAFQEATVPQNLEDGRKLVFSDEFDAAGAVDRAKWGFENGRIRNDEQQWFTGDRPLNSFVAEGRLVVQARRECWDVQDYTSASLYALRPILHARVEVRAKLPAGKGLASLVWLVSTRYPQVPWPDCGQVSLLQHAGAIPDEVGVVVNTKAQNVELGNEVSESLTVPKLTEGFHTFTLDWTPDDLSVEVDGEEAVTYEKDPKDPASWPFGDPMTLKIQLGVGGGLGETQETGKDFKHGVDVTMFPKQLLVDYVRVYE